MTAALAIVCLARADALADPPTDPAPAATTPAATTPAAMPPEAEKPPAAGPPAAPEPAPIPGQRSIGIGAEIGFNTGLGAALHLGAPKVGLYVAGGIMPLFIIGNENNASRSLTFDVYRAYALNVDLYAMLYQGSPQTDVGFCAGYSGNTVLGHGLNLGIALRRNLAEKVAFTLFGGLEIFPDARDHLAAHGYPGDRDPPIPQLQGGVNAGVVIYP
ncbi:MAG: hypothetical protein E6J90_50820 [Deltaproteobacteria bacterium]|nr:MAG: hypothetical protein E6J91_43360 [Deltaproteobacteria bacterium]TMQ04698.1 MAG: hypothetical protein E6J90_50820 [Deltaproteobacteria bacterium]